MENKILGNILTIESLKNNLIKKIFKLTKKKYRYLNQMFIAEGEDFLVEAIKNNWEIEYILLDRDVNLSNIIVRLINNYQNENLKIIRANKEILTKLSSNNNNQNLIFVSKLKKNSLPTSKIPRVCVAIENIQDPGNLGTIIRTLDAFCVNTCILVDNCVDQYSRDVVRSSVGSIFSLKIVNCSSKEFIAWISYNLVKLYVTDISAKTNYQIEDWELPMCLLLGNEKLGLSNNLKTKCNKLIKIFMRGGFHSLNVSVANGILLSDIIRKNPNTTSF